MQGDKVSRAAVVFAAGAAAVIGTAVIIEATGGLPSQLAHLYYIPVVASALLLRTRLSLVVALLAAAAVSPLPDLVHRPLGMNIYYADPAPWNLSPSGWIVRPLAFIAISLLAGRLVRETGERIAAQVRLTTLESVLGHEQAGKLAAEKASASRGRELRLLSEIDKMILSGSSEEEAVQEVARLVSAFTDASVAGIVVANREGERLQSFHGYSKRRRAQLTRETMPLGEGVSGWALLRGKPATSPNVFADARYERMAEFARELGYVSAAAVPIILDGEVLAALVLGFEAERNFFPEDIATLERIADQAAVAIANARQRDTLERLMHETAIALTDAIESRDPYTGDHCGRLALYATLTARALDLRPKEVEVIRLGAALHDVGKIVVPDAILKKPGKLTPDEFAIIKQHCYSGGQICKRVSFLQAAYPIVYHHHERWDGRGYPDGISGEAIPLGARIVAVVDAYDAMTTDRPYRKAMPKEEVEAILRDGAGSQWDPDITEKFLSVIASASNDPDRRTDSPRSRKLDVRTVQL